ncbi:MULTISPECIES: hypothetical protein [Arthrobacter]
MNNDALESLAKDKNYNLVWVLEASMKNTWKLEPFIQEAERQGDDELAEWFRKIQDNNRKAVEQGKRMLMQRLGSS